MCCHALHRRQVETGYLYAFHAPEYEVEESKALLTQYYWEIFQIACLDVVREWAAGVICSGSTACMKNGFAALLLAQVFMEWSYLHQRKCCN